MGGSTEGCGNCDWTGCWYVEVCCYSIQASRPCDGDGSDAPAFCIHCWWLTNHSGQLSRDFLQTDDLVLIVFVLFYSIIIPLGKYYYDINTDNPARVVTKRMFPFGTSHDYTSLQQQRRHTRSVTVVSTRPSSCVTLPHLLSIVSEHPLHTFLNKVLEWHRV